MHSGKEKIIWRCGAGNANRSYQVMELDKSAKYFDLAIYNGPIFAEEKYIETVRITVNNNEQILTGSGKTLTGKTVNVAAFGGTVAFNVDDEEFGSASGRCHRQAELN